VRLRRILRETHNERNHGWNNTKVFMDKWNSSQARPSVKGLGWSGATVHVLSNLPLSFSSGMCICDLAKRAYLHVKD